MQQLVFFLLGEKGYEVLKGAIAADCKDLIRLVVIGEDGNVQKDFSSEIVDLCIEKTINYCTRNDVSKIIECANEVIAIAAGWRWLIRFSFIQVIVFHDSLLPRYRGFNPLVTALLNQDSEVGVTVINANKEFDRGDIIESRSIKVNYPVSIKDVVIKVSGLYFDLSQFILRKIASGESLVGIKQDETKASYSVWRDEQDYRINWENSAASIAHFVKCLSFPYKGASAVCDDKLIRILEAEIETDVRVENRDVGKVLFVINGKPIVICRDGLLRVDVAIDDKGQTVLPFKKFRTRLK